MTVTLFSAIFFFVTSFPSPSPQNSNQFQGSLQATTNGTYIQSISILHLGGPSVAGSDLVYLKGALTPSYTSFASALTVSAGLSGASTWNLGQTWLYTFPTPQPRLQNVTVYVVAPTQLLYSVVLPGQAFYTPPTVSLVWASPTVPTVGGAFTIYAVFTGTTAGIAPTINLASIPGLPSSAQSMTATGAANEWEYSVPASSTTTNGTYYVVISATNSVGQSGTGSIAITLAGTSGSSAPPLTVAVSLTTTPPQMAGTGGPSLNLEAAVTYNGALSGASLNVSFYVNQTTPSASASYSGHGAAGLTISGVSTVTAFSTTRWSMPSLDAPRSYVVVASATVGGTISSQGNLTIVVPLGIGASNSSTPTVKKPTTIDGKLYLNSTAYGAGPFTYESTTQAVSIFINFTSNGTASAVWHLATGTLTISPGGTATFAGSSAWDVPNITGSATTYLETMTVYVAGIGLVTQSFQFTVAK